MVRVLVAEDHSGMREAVCRLLNGEFSVVASVADGRSMLEAESELKPDVVVLDISMPVMSGLFAARQLVHRDPKARIVFLTVHDDPAFLAAAMEAGGLGYVIKSRMATDLTPAVREAVSGRKFVSSSSELTPEKPH